MRALLGVVLVFGMVAVGMVSGAGATADVSGVTYPLDPDVESEQISIAQDRLQSVADVPETAYAIVTPTGEGYVVLTDSVPGVAEGTVSGTVYPHPTAAGFIVAESTSLSHSGTPIDVDELRQNASGYQYDLVQLHAETVRASYTFDPAGNTFVYQPSIHDVGVEGQRLRWTHPGRAAREVVRNVSGQSFEGSDRVLSPVDAPGGLASHKRVWWGQSEQTVNGLVYNDYGAFVTGRTTTHGTPVSGVRELAGRDGEVVTVTAMLRGGRLSSQETLVEVAGCGESAVVFPGSGCAPAPADVVLHSGVAYSGTPEERSDVIFYIGMSNTIQTEPIQPENGRYRVTGRVVDASRIDPRLNRTALLILDRERVGDVTRPVPDVAPDVDTTRLLWEQVVSSREKWVREHPDGNVLGAVDRPETATPTATATSSPTPAPTATATIRPAPTASPPPTPTAAPATARSSPCRIEPWLGMRLSGQVEDVVTVFAQVVALPFVAACQTRPLLTGGLFVFVVMAGSSTVLAGSLLYHDRRGTDSPFSRDEFHAVLATAVVAAIVIVASVWLIGAVFLAVLVGWAVTVWSLL